MNSLVIIVKRFPFREQITSNLPFYTLKLSVVKGGQVHDEVLLGLFLYISLQFGHWFSKFELNEKFTRIFLQKCLSNFNNKYFDSDALIAMLKNY